MPSKDEIESWVHDLSNGLLQFDEKKNKIGAQDDQRVDYNENWPWTPSDPGIGHVALYFALSSTLESKEIPYFAPEVTKQSPWPFEISSWKDTELEDPPCGRYEDQDSNFSKG